MDLTSYSRLLRYVVGNREATNTDDAKGRRDLIIWIPAVSKQVEGYLNRTIETGSYTEYFDLEYGQKEFRVSAFPVTTLTSVYYDPTGEWEGDESELTDNFIGVDSRSIFIRTTLSTLSARGIRIIYTGGMAAHGTRSTFTISTSAGTWHTGKYVVGGTSSAVGIVRTASATSITVEVLYGVFVAAETLTEYDSEETQGSSDAVATLTAKTATALCETYPDLVLATEMQIRYMWANKHGFENTGVTRDGQTIRSMTEGLNIPLRPEVMAMLGDYQRIAI